MGILSIDRTIEKMKRTKLVTWSNNIQKMHEGAEKRRREHLEITSGEKLRKDGKLMWNVRYLSNELGNNKWNKYRVNERASNETITDTGLHWQT